MGRRRRRSGGEDLIGPIVALVFLLVFWASGFNIQRATQIIQGLFGLLIVGVVSVGVVGILFFVIRAIVRARRARVSLPITEHNRLPTFVNAAPPQPPVSGKSWRFDDLVYKDAGNAGQSVSSPPVAESLVEKLRATDWYQFEKVVGLIYQSQGYILHRRGGANPDGGIDLIIEKNGERAAVQCKRWKKWKLDVPKVRELFGAMTHEGIPRGVMVSLNGFTLDAKQLAVEHNIDIVHDENLCVMITGLSQELQKKVVEMLDDETKHCPKCEALMIWRTPKPGKKQFVPFWGCSRYPQCYGRLND